MLKALELVGFKSFADKTRFEFPPGITVVVGPNGSGKSNIVDAIKWVLGEQSAKSLRGKDMADVIFKGSGSGRRVMNTAEATIVIDNQDGRLSVDATEVHVTRRVYRSGEGEYLINGQACRLKDVRDLFRGTGVGTDAYSLIEQGKVDRLLQASPKDRRAIFEEAAGISRFKAKKIEAQRRLQRVDQNLLRLSDIVDEVDNRLRSIRNQASKARRYREYSQRLQELRTQVGLADWRRLTARLDEMQLAISQLRDQANSLSAQSEAEEALGLELDTTILQIGESLRSCEQRQSANRERIASLESTAAHQRSTARELEDAERRYRTQLALLNTRAGDLQHRLAEVTEALEQAESGHGERRQQVADLENELRQLDQRLQTLRTESEQLREQYVDQTRQVAQLGNQAVQYESQIEAAQETSQRLRARVVQFAQQRQQWQDELLEAEQGEQRIAAQCEETADELHEAQQQLDEWRHVQARRQHELTVQQGRFSGCRERARLIEELEARQEGLNSGVQQVLQLAANAQGGPWKDVCGVVADLLRVDVEVAPMVDAALGPAAQFVVLQGDTCWQELRRGAYRPAGRIGFLRMDALTADGPQPQAPDSAADTQLAAADGVLGRADRMVQCDARYQPLVRRLLGRTWFVQSLDIALEWAGRFPQTRFVASDGAVVEPGGAVVLGPAGTAEGLVSRRSQLRVLHQEIAILQERIAEFQAELTRLGENIARQERLSRDLTERRQQLTGQLADQQVATRTLRQRCEQLDEQRALAEAEAGAAEAQQARATEQLSETKRRLAMLEESLAQVAQRMRDDESQLEQLGNERQQVTRRATSARVELATSEQQLDGLRRQRDQFAEDRQERSRAIREARTQLADSGTRRLQSERIVLRATSELAELYLAGEALGDESRRLIQQRTAIQQQRAELNVQLQQVRREIRELEKKLHDRELAAGTVEHERQAVAERLRDDYQIELSQLQEQVSEEEQHQREEVDAEIADLRQKLNRIGAVNMEALDELDELEARHQSLAGQYDDLDQAKQALERIIHKINADSRRLFQETLEAIRTNFQSLYRKAFGGGRADIVLEDGVDILECGVEIIATPPGKPSFNNSLLSGGEKALTAVALLLAIFQFRPSPFCVLDEVDAPFDEANIGRFIEVLRDFLGWTKFVIVTHSKKTMTAATTLYGVTMQESGVSKQVSVRFEDVSEDGQISDEAVQRSTADGGDDEQAA